MFSYSQKLKSSQLIQPIFIEEGLKSPKIIKGLGQNYSHTLKSAKKMIESDLKRGVKNFIFFIVPKKKQSRPQNFDFHYKSLSNIKKKFGKRIIMIVDTCLCSITTDGHCGITHHNKINLKETHKSLGLAALTFINAGADIIAPSDMMKGTTKYLKSLFNKKKINTPIMSYSTKFFSSFYGPFRNAVDSYNNLQGSSKETYQMDFANITEASLEIKLDINEGADMIIIKPGLPYLDIVSRIKDKYSVPVFSYHVSGEYSMIKAAAEKKYIEEKATVLEAMYCFKRAGCNAVLTYYTPEILKWLDDK